MRNPLSKRYLRQLRNNAGKYLGMFAMMLLAVSFTGGFLLASNSMEAILVGMDEKYKIEDGHFVCDIEAEDEAIRAVEELGVTVYPDFYRQVALEPEREDERSEGIKARLYANRTHINLPAYAEGRAPEAADEVALDRVFMANHSLAVGNVVLLDGKRFEIVGICTLPDYQALFENNTDLVHNAITFTVGQLTPEGLSSLSATSEVFAYSFVLDDQSLDLAGRLDVEEEMIEALVDADCVVSDFVDVDDNSGIGFAIDDVLSDRAVFTVVLFLLIIIMAFVFTVLTGATIESESAVIGTMLASGWRKSELLRHYLFLPAVTGLASVILGLIVGVTVLVDPLKGLYYNSYSIPPYELHWDASIVFFTTVLPFLILMVVTITGLVRKLRFTPLQFLRHEVASGKRRANLPLPDGLKYTTRFRLRVLLRNASHFIMLFFGIAFASLLLLMGICLMPVVRNYSAEMRKTVVSPYQYVLKVPLELEGTDEERKRYAAALRLIEDRERIEENRDSVDAAERLNENTALMDALERLTDNTELMDALDRLQDRDDLFDVIDRMSGRDDVMDAAARVDEGTASMQDMLLLASLDRQTLDDLEVLADLDEQTRDDLELLDGLDEAVRDDIDLVRGVDEATRADIDLVREMDEDLLDDVRMAADIDEDANLINTKENTAAAIAQAEKFAMASVEIKRASTDKLETVTVYGILPDSRYWTDIDVTDGVIYISRGTIEKTVATLGEPFEAINRREGESYTITATQSTDNEADVALYMTLDDFNRLFDNDADYFNAYASAEALDLDARYMARVIVPEDMDKVSVQMEDSMGDFSKLMLFMAVPIYLVLVYLLTKTVIDRSARSISYMKVFGYHSNEVNGLYVRPITYWTLFSLVASLPLVMGAILGMLSFAFSRFSGNFPIVVPPDRLVLLVVVGMATYAVVALLHIRRIRQVPLELAMKVQE